jgi:hypothetical protein
MSNRPLIRACLRVLGRKLHDCTRKECQKFGKGQKNDRGHQRVLFVGPKEGANDHRERPAETSAWSMTGGEEKQIRSGQE